MTSRQVIEALELFKLIDWGMLDYDTLLLIADNIAAADEELTRVQKNVNTAIDAIRDKSVLAKWNRHQQAKAMGKNVDMLPRRELDAIEPIIQSYNEKIEELFQIEIEKESKVSLQPITFDTWKILLASNPMQKVDLARQMRVLCNIQ